MSKDFQPYYKHIYVLFVVIAVMGFSY